MICKMSKKKKILKETGVSKDQNFVCSDNPVQSIWNKKEKSSKTGQDKKSLVSTFACILIAIAKVKFLEWGLGTGQCLHPNLRLSLFPYFLRS